MKMKKLPLGIHDLPTIINGGYVYADKTKYICNLINEGQNYFLSRPRRFGKSLLLSTVASLFRGEKELFQGLWIDGSDMIVTEDKDGRKNKSKVPRYDFTPHPVIRLDMFETTKDSKITLAHSLILILKGIADNEGLVLMDGSPGDLLRQLILGLRQKYGTTVAVLIDEYDSPIIHHILNPILADENRILLKQFYGVLKSQGENIRFLFITGVTKFVRSSIFSELNHLTDITLNGNFANICGFTIDEAENLFEEHLTVILEAFKTKGNWHPDCTLDDLKAEILEWYNGYSWDGESKVLNPYSLMLFIQNMDFSDFWFGTGTPGYLADLVHEQRLSLDLVSKDQVISEKLNAVDIGQFRPVPLMFQSGYLTVDRVEGFGGTKEFYLKIPNYEVWTSFSSYLLAREIGLDIHDDLYVKASGILKALKMLDPTAAEAAMKAFLSIIPWRMHGNSEGYYHTVLYLAMNIISQKVTVEKNVANGTIDAIIPLPGSHVFVVEMKYLPKAKPKSKTEQGRKPKADVKVNGGRPEAKKSAKEPLPTASELASIKTKMTRAAQKALRQIEQKGYAIGYLSARRKVYKAAIVVHHRNDVMVILEEFTG